ncbi:S8 family peptidase [Serinibacter salmoneus]|uniref:S-layer family protein n=1 Tax=Serinibacter salmoneus TaxID=556530 RepID=A0A2A9D0T9_9MICO|nr:S8 family serine peptidase [Serinibacter salmoneus]PFG19459.1 S-layer family protein [Serinibacter salmoneus]
MTNSSMRGRWWRTSAATAAAAALVAATAAGATAAPEDLPTAETVPSDRSLELSSEGATSNLNPDEGRVAAFVELTSETTREVTLGRSGLAAQQSAQQAAAATDALASEVVAAIDDDATTLYTTVNAVAGVAVEADAAALLEIAERDDVVSVKRIVLKEPTLNAGTDIFTGATAAWEDLGVTGEGETIAVIDTGIDYTHTDFGHSDITYPTTLDAAAETQFVTDPGWPQGKVIGGWDFVGRTYTGTSAGTEAMPDPNPLDESPAMCTDVPADISRGGGHGTHVAGTAAGYGTNADGSTFEGDYATLTSEDLLSMKVGPGSAPEADLVALKVFGCAGSTAYVSAALDWLADPTNEVAEQTTVVNLSVGSVLSAADDPENAFVDALTEDGKVVVISSGNGGDTFDVGGSPGNASSALTVANSIGSTFEFAGATVITGDTEEVVAGQYSINYAFGDGTVGPLELVTLSGGSLNYLSGCEPYTAEDAAAVAGKAVVVAWDDNNTLPCGSTARTTYAADAGAEGIVFTGLNEVFSAGLSGAASIPTFQFTGPVTADLLTYDPSTGVISVNEPTEIIFDNSLQVIAQAPAMADTLNDSSSRGVHGTYGIVKPDVAAPGTTISSADVGSIDSASIKSGTSMSAPHVAGIAALTAQSHPDWSPVQVKAAVMNTANHDVTLDGTPFGPQRVGSGRVDALDAVTNDIIAYSAEEEDLVTVTFGIVAVDESFSETKPVEIANSGDEAVTLDVAYTAQSEMPGAQYTVSPSSVTVPAGGTATVDVTLTIDDPAALAKVADPTLSMTQLGLSRQWVATPQGWLEFAGAPETDGALRVPVSSAVKPVADLGANDVTFGSALATSTVLEMTGTGLNQDGYLSLVAPFELAGTSGQLEETTRALDEGMDLAAVGTAPVSYEVANDYVYFGIATHDSWPTLGGSAWLDVTVETGEGTYNVQTIKYSDGFDYYDIPVVGVWDSTGGNTGLEFLNDIPNIDTNTFDTSVAVLPVSLDSLGYSAEEIAAGDISFEYSVTGYVETDPVDTITGLTYDMATNLRFGDTSSALYVGAPGTGIEVHRTAAAMAGADAEVNDRVEVEPTGTEVLLLSLHNGVGDQAITLETQNVVPNVPADQVFIDVAPGNLFFDDISWLYDQGITTGWETPEGLEYRPLSSINRDAMAAFLYRYDQKFGSQEPYTPPTTSPFVDVSTSNQFYTEIAWLYEQGISTGWETAAGVEFRPLQPIARDAMAAFLYRYDDVDDFTPPAESEFLDVSTSNQFYTEIAWLGSTGISTGWEVDGGFEYRPLEPIARDAMAAFLYRYDNLG